MRRARRSSDPHRQLDRLEQRHRVLDRLVSELDERNYLSPSDQVRRLELKKQKLAAKDELNRMRARLTGSA